VLVGEQVRQGSGQASEKEISVKLSSIFPLLVSKVASVVYEGVEGAVICELNPASDSPITELLKVPVILIVLEETLLQVPIKLTKLVQVINPTVK
jgi:hypothetical protein